MRYLLDENLPPSYRTQLLRRQPDLMVWSVGMAGAPPTGMLDPAILCWCEDHAFVLVTNNRRSMPTHLADHLAAGRHVPGILVLRFRAEFGRVIDDLLLIAAAAQRDEFQDQIVFVPL